MFCVMWFVTASSMAEPIAARASQSTWMVVEDTASYVVGLFAKRACADQLGGVIGIADIAGQVAKLGFVPIVGFAALMSVSIGLFNLLPVPLLDGGHLLFYAIEAVRGRPLSERAQEFGFRVGLALVTLLMIFVTYNDLYHRLGPKIMKILAL